MGPLRLFCALLMTAPRQRLLIVIASFIVFIFLFTMPHICIAQDASPPDLAAFTPEAYKAREIHGAVDVRVIGQGLHRAYLFVPAEPTPSNVVPLVIFHHGWLGMNPMNFGSLIDHLTRSGHAVVFPVYQLDEHTSPLSITENAAFASRQALNVLNREFALVPEPGRTIYYGFSIGAGISANLALQGPEYGLPPPDALILIAPGDACHVANGRWSESIYPRLENLPPNLPVVIMTGADDAIGLPTAQKLTRQLCHIPRDHRITYVLPSSTYRGHQTSRVMAGHGSPGAPDSRYNFSLSQTIFPQQLAGRPDYEASPSLNQLDFYGYWKIIDGVVDGLASGRFPEFVFAQNSDIQLNLGYWRDGTPLNPMSLIEACTNDTSTDDNTVRAVPSASNAP